MTTSEHPHLRLPVSANSIAVRWMALDDMSPDQWVDLAGLLDATERARAAQFRFDRDRCAFIAAHALKRTMLSAAAPKSPAQWRFISDSHGKPQVVRGPDGPPLRFNISHTRGLVAVALTLDHDVGVDVEAIDPDRFSLELAERVLAAEEVAMLRATPPANARDALFAVWTLKEACVKAMGRGLSVPLDSFSVTLDPLAVRFDASLSDDGAQWLLLRLAPTPSHALAVAARHPDPGRVRIDANPIQPDAVLTLAAQLA